MRYIKLKNGIPCDYTIEQLMIEYPNAIIYERTQMPSEKLLKQYDVYPLITESKPNLNEDEKAEESTPEFRDGEWHQTWVIKKLTEDEINEIIKNKTPAINSTDIIADGILNFITNETVQTYRLSICNSCESFTIFKTCKECNCIMALKTRMLNSECPLNKW